MIADIDVCVKDENDLQRLFARIFAEGNYFGKALT